jgi:hypothetical protein
MSGAQFGLDSPAMRRPTERQVTDAAAEIAARDPLFAVHLARSLLSVAAAKDGVPARRAHDLLRHLPRRHLRLLSEHHAPHDGLLDIWRRVHRSRIDWLFLGRTFVLAVEVKTRARTAFQPWQLANYRRVVREQRLPHSGLLALTLVPPSPGDMLRSGRSGVLGYVLWKDAATLLRETTLREARDEERWRSLVEGVLRPE